MQNTRKRIIRRFTWTNVVKAGVTKKSCIVWGLVGFYLIIMLFLSVGPVFRVMKIDCHTSNSQPCPDFVIPELEKYLQTSVFLINNELLEARIAATIPQAESVIITEKFPNTMLVTIQWQPGVAYLRVPTSETAYEVSKSNQIMGLAEHVDQNLPVIIASSAADLIISQTLTDSSLIASLDIIKRMSDYNFKIQSINIVSKQDIRADLNGEKTVQFTSNASIDDQLHRLQLILSQTTMNAAQSIIDVRYDKPAIKQSF